MDYLWTEFKDRSAQVMQQNHGDQDWISKRTKDDITWFPDEWIRSYKWEMIGFKDTKSRRGPKFVFLKEPKVTEQNKVAVFHGEPKPFNCGDKFVLENWK